MFTDGESTINGTRRIQNLDFTGENDITWHVTHKEAVFEMVIHSIYDMWHYESPWTYVLTWVLWYTCDCVCWILYIMLHTTNLKASCQMHFMGCSQVRSEVHSWLHSIAHFLPAWLTLSTKLARHSQVHSGYAVMATRDCGRVPAILYSQLATRLRFLAIIVYIHIYLLSLESTFATVYQNYHTYAYKAECWRTCP